MRLWMVDTSKMCDRHLLGEHVETHMMIGSIKKGKSLKGFIEKKLINVPDIYNRHDALMIEMIVRGFKHRSPIQRIRLPYYGHIHINKYANEIELAKRCKYCRRKINELRLVI